MNRTRLLLVAALLIIIAVAVGAFLFISGSGSSDGTGDTGGSTQVANNQQAENLTPSPSPTEFPRISVVVAIRDIPRGVQITPDMIAVIAFPLVPDEEGNPLLPSGTFGDIDDVVGRIARSDIARDQFILSRHIVEALNLADASSQLSPTGSDAAAVIESNRVAISLPIDAITSVAYALQPGDSVDVMVSMLFVDVDPDFQTILPTNLSFAAIQQELETGSTTLSFVDAGAGLLDSRSLQASSVGSGSSAEGDLNLSANQTFTSSVLLEPSEVQRPRLVTQRTVIDAKVVWVGEFPENGRLFSPAPTPTVPATADPNATEEPTGQQQGPPPTPTRPPRPNIVTLAVRPQDAVVLSYMAEAGMPMTFALRSARAQQYPLTEPVTLDYIMQTFNIRVPDRFSYAIEPAIRSIRELSLGNRISLGRAEDEEPLP